MRGAPRGKNKTYFMDGRDYATSLILPQIGRNAQYDRYVQS